MFFTRLAFLSTLTNANMLNCISMNSQKFKVRPQIVNVNGDDPVFFFILVLKQVYAVIVATTSIIHSQNCVFLML